MLKKSASLKKAEGKVEAERGSDCPHLNLSLDLSLLGNVVWGRTSVQDGVNILQTDQSHLNPRVQGGRAQMGEKQHLLQLSQRWMEGRFLFIDVEPCPCDGSRAEGVDQRSFIDDRTTSGIDDEGGGAHPGQFARADQMVGGWREGHMDRHDIGLPEEIL